MTHQARKRFGQHFLTDQSMIERIIQAIDPLPHQRMVEIGPGLSALTQPLLQCLGHLQVVEVDRDLVQRLQHTYTTDQLTIHAIDALQFDFHQCGAPLRIVGNLPYNISSPLLFHLMDAVDVVVDQHFMLQKEVVDRMVARPGTSENGRLSIMLQTCYKMIALFDVPPECFSPAPKVMSSIVRMKPLEQRLSAHNPTLFQTVVTQGFGQRRKMLRRSLQQYPIHWPDLSITPSDRPEDLGVHQWIELVDHIDRHQTSE